MNPASRKRWHEFIEARVSVAGWRFLCCRGFLCVFIIWHPLESRENTRPSLSGGITAWIVDVRSPLEMGLIRLKMIQNLSCSTYERPQK